MYLQGQKTPIKSIHDTEAVQIAMCKVNNQFVKFSLKLDYFPVQKPTVNCKSICVYKRCVILHC